MTGVLNYSGSSSFYINKGTNTDTLLYGNHVCFGNTSGAIQTASNGTPFQNGFYSGTNIIPVTIVDDYNTAYPSLYIVNAYNSTSQSVGMEINFSKLSTLSTSTYFIHFNNSTSVVGSIIGSGNNSSVTYSTTSDERIKENILLIDPSEHYNLLKNNDNQTYQYNFINDDSNNKQVRFIACFNAKYK